MPAETAKTFETIPNPHPDNDYLVTITAPEFTCLCPVTGHPDFATITVEYAPGERIVELRSFKLYLQSFRNEGHFHEHIANRILNDLAGATAPRKMSVTADYTVRGGIHTVVKAHFVRPDAR